MKLFFQIEIGHHKGGKAMVNYASSLSSDILGTDLDSQSEPMIADLVIKMIAKSDKVFLFVDANDPNIPLLNSKKVFSYLSEVCGKISNVVLCGEHRSTENLLNTLNPRFVRESDAENIKKLIQEFSRL